MDEKLKQQIRKLLSGPDGPLHFFCALEEVCAEMAMVAQIGGHEDELHWLALARRVQDAALHAPLPSSVEHSL
jgi:hypothetical protein